MPNTKSAIRRVRRVKKQTQVNRIRRSKYKNAIKRMENLIKSKNGNLSIASFQGVISEKVSYGEFVSALRSIFFN